MSRCLDFGNGNVLSTTTALLGLSQVAPVSTAWPSANLAIFAPVRVPSQITICKLAIGAGSTAAGNFDVGIYDANGNLLVSSGATAKGADVPHILDVTNTVLGAGLYYLAMSADGTNNYILITPAGSSPVPLQKARLYGTLQMASAYPLPSTAAFAARTGAIVPAIAAYPRDY